ncbi:MAG: adenylate kinase [Thermoplasmatales archaeon]
MVSTKVVIGGIPGVGKTTVLGNLVNAGLTVENFGDIMLKQAVSKGYVNDRDEMRKMPPKLQLEIQKGAADYFSKKKSVIIDTHLSIKTTSGFLPGIPWHILEILKPDLIVSLEADPHDIFLRRANDSTRSRDSDSEDDIQAHLEINRMYGVSYSAMSGCPFMIVKNRTGMANEASKEILAAILRK